MSAVRLLRSDEVSATSTSYEERAIALYAHRRARSATFERGSDIFQEPAWDILLDLFIAHEHGRATTISNACVAACVPTSTALRWLSLLERRAMVRRWNHERDGRTKLLGLTPKAVEMMLRYLDQV